MTDKNKVITGLILSVAGLFLCVVLSLAAGSRFVPAADVISALTDRSINTFDAIVVREREHC